MASPGGHWLGLDVPISTSTARVVSLGTPRERVVSVGTLAKLAYAKNVIYFDPPTPALGLMYRIVLVFRLSETGTCDS